MLSQEIRAELLTLHQRLQDSEADREHVLSQEVTDLREQLRVAKETPADHQKEVDNSTSLQNYIETLVAIDIDTPSQSTFADNEVWYMVYHITVMNYKFFYSVNVIEKMGHL